MVGEIGGEGSEGVGGGDYKFSGNVHEMLHTVCLFIQ